jgi:hypothetical protein
MNERRTRRATGSGLLLALLAGLPLGCGGTPGNPNDPLSAQPDAAPADEWPAADSDAGLPALVECPHAVPTDGGLCVPPNYAACTYPADDDRCDRLSATCRAGQWVVTCVPPFQPMLL